MAVTWHKHASRVGIVTLLAPLLIGLSAVRVAPGGTWADVAQVGINAAVLADLTLNTVLLGSPKQTVSARTALACNAGSAAACGFCRVLTYGQVVVTFGSVTRDHCALTLDPATETTARAVWDWIGNRIEPNPHPAS